MIICWIIILSISLVLLGINKNKAYNEKDTLRYIVRAQVPYDNNKQDTYFAKINDQDVFVKGPFLDLKAVENCLFVQNLKKELGLNYIPVEVMYLKPDLKINSIGIKKQLDKNEKYPFLIFKNIAGGKVSKYKTTIVDGKRVVDWSKNHYCKTLNFKHLQDPQILKQYVQAILFKKIIGVDDMADRNFMVRVHNKKVYSLDEEDLNKKFSAYKNLDNYGKKDIVQNYIFYHHNEITEMLNKWKNKIEEIKNLDKQKLDMVTQNLQEINLKDL